MAKDGRLIQRLQRLAEQVEDNKAEVARVEGRRDSLLKRLKDDFDIGSIEEGKQMLADLVRKMEKAETALAALVDELEGDMT